MSLDVQAGRPLRYVFLCFNEDHAYGIKHNKVVLYVTLQKTLSFVDNSAIENRDHAVK